MLFISGLHKTLTFLDISYATKVTDEGLKHFEPHQYELSSLILNNIPGITSAGLSIIIGCCSDYLMELEAALLPQPEVKGDFFVNLAKCSQLEYLDLTGNHNIDDMSFTILSKHEVINGTEKFKPGMPYLHTVRLSGLNIGDFAIMELLKVTKSIEHIEIAKCTSMTESSINKLIETCENLQYVDMNGIPAISYPFLDDVMKRKPELMIKRYKF
jgi:hypothetical protein